MTRPTSALLGALAALFAGACGFTVPSGGQPGVDAPGDDAANDGAVDGAIDAFVPDAAACTAVSAQCVAGTDILRTCAGPGVGAVDTTCAWGCLGGSTDPHCGVIAASGGTVLPVDVDGTMDGMFTGATEIVINGTTKTIGGAAWLDADVNNTTNVAIFRFNDLTIDAPIRLSGTHAIALVASGDVTINTVIDGRPALCTPPAAGPGGYPGGPVSTTGSGPGVVVGGEGGANNDDGGGGGGHGAAGGAGGSPDGTKPAGGTAFGDDAITVLQGGAGGGGGGDRGGTIGGGGGAALQIVAGGTITITATGGINPGGCGGKQSGSSDSASGGGGGGTILLEAHTVSIEGALAANGGGGGNGGGGTAGAAGRLDRTAAAGGTGGNGQGGTGGAGSSLGGQAGAYGGPRAGGGGGAIGRIRINTRSGTATIESTAVISPALTDNPTTATQGAAQVQ